MNWKIVIIILCSISLSSCDNIINSDDTSPINSNGTTYKTYYNNDDLFKVRLFIEEGPYNKKNHIDVFSTLEYIGDEDVIEIWSGDPYFKYIIRDDEGTYYSEGLQLDVLMSNELENGTIYTFPFQKSGGYSAEQSDAKYWREYYSDSSLKLPPGNYKMTAFLYCTLNNNTKKHKNEVKVKFEVGE